MNKLSKNLLKYNEVNTPAVTAPTFDDPMCFGRKIMSKKEGQKLAKFSRMNRDLILENASHAIMALAVQDMFEGWNSENEDEKKESKKMFEMLLPYMAKKKGADVTIEHKKSTIDNDLAKKLKALAVEEAVIINETS